MSSIPHLVGMIHLKPLPGSPGYAGSMGSVIEAALSDSTILAEAGFPALMIENFGDAPFYGSDVPPETVAGLTRSVDAVLSSTGLPVGVNALRNDSLAAMAIAAATGAALIRVNVLTGVMYTDQGPIAGQAAELLRLRSALQCDAEIWADVMVKHATPPPGLDARQAAQDTVKRGMADALIVSGSGTGAAPDIVRLKEVRAAVGDDVRIAIGSGANPDNMAELAGYADTIIVGSATKHDGVATNGVDPARAHMMVEAAEQAGFLSSP